MAKVAKTHIVVEREQESLLDQVVAATKVPIPEPIPTGFILLEAGTKREIHVNRQWLQYSSEKPVAITVKGYTTFYKEVRLLGTCRMVAGEVREGSGCCAEYKRTARIVTEGPVLVKP